MSEITYTNLMNRTLDLYIKGDYLKAYNYITENAKKVKGNDAQIYNFRYSIACKAGLNDLAMEIMNEAVVKKGYWYSYDYLIEDDDLKPLNKYDSFYKLANICKEREGEAKIKCKPDLKIIEPRNLVSNEKYPLLMALHGNEENILITEDYWSSCTINNYILGLPQSSEIGFSDGYYWNDVEKGAEELKSHYENILEQYIIDSENLIIGGFSAGAKAALYSILNDIIKAKGCIFVAPWLPEINQWEHLLDKLKSKGTKCYVICGDKDEDCLECTENFVLMLNERNIPNVFKIVKDLDHDYPCNFDKYLKNAIEFISH